jgi:hypothetical protein
MDAWGVVFLTVGSSPNSHFELDRQAAVQRREGVRAGPEHSGRRAPFHGPHRRSLGRLPLRLLGVLAVQGIV